MGLKSTIFSAFIAITVLFLAGVKPAQATYNYWLMCWVPSDSLGAHECKRLPNSWRIRGVRKKYCRSSNHFCGRSKTSFRINRRNLGSMRRYGFNRRDLGTVVTIYTGLYR